MAVNSLLIEQRKDPRFRIPGLSFTTTSFASGSIIDLSLGGLSFYHIGNGLYPTGSFEAGHLFGNDINLSHIPVRIVSDYIIDDKTFIYDLKRYSAQFNKLSFRQRYKLEKIIWATLAKKTGPGQLASGPLVAT